MPDNEEPADLEDLDELDELDWLRPPEDVHDAAGWNRYWKAQVDHAVAGFHDMFLQEEGLARLMAARGLESVLCAGNGVSLQPHALAYAGFNVTAADLSTWAIELIRDLRPDSKYLKKLLYGSIFFRPIFWRSMPETCRRLGWLFVNVQKHLFNPLRHGGGTLEFLSGDLLDPGLCKGPFDVVIERCMVQLFSGAERDEILEKLTARLSPTGIFVSHCHMGWWRPGTPRDHILEAWFREHGFKIIEDSLRSLDELSKIPGRIAMLSVSTG
jgi:hypothetical protein